jgi:hypothetical protein
MVDIELDADEFAGLEFFFDKYGQVWMSEMSASLATAAEIIRGWLEDYTPRRTGTTATSWRVIAFDRNDYDISNLNEPIITFLTEGTRPHRIPTSGNTLLHWTDNEGFDHFAMHVQHLGTEPIDIVGQALDAAEPELEELWDAADDAASRDMGFK